jgi:hypothetical protein
MTDTTPESPSGSLGSEGGGKGKGDKSGSEGTHSASKMAEEITQHLLTALKKTSPSTPEGKKAPSPSNRM